MFIQLILYKISYNSFLEWQQLQFGVEPKFYGMSKFKYRLQTQYRNAKDKADQS